LVFAAVLALAFFFAGLASAVASIFGFTPYW
jgi:hypothetical protein